MVCFKVDFFFRGFIGFMQSFPPVFSHFKKHSEVLLLSTNSRMTLSWVCNLLETDLTSVFLRGFMQRFPPEFSFQKTQRYCFC